MPPETASQSFMAVSTSRGSTRPGRRLRSLATHKVLRALPPRPAAPLQQSGDHANVTARPCISWLSVVKSLLLTKEVAMKNLFGFMLIAFALLAGSVGVVSVASSQAFACDGDHRGS
jgi:hypothetical protein